MELGNAIGREISSSHSQHFSVLPTFSLCSQTSRVQREISSPIHWVGSLIKRVFSSSAACNTAHTATP